MIALRIVDFELISGNIRKTRLFAFMQFSLVTPIGREILHVLDENLYVKVTLNTGRRNLKLHINETECYDREITRYQFIATKQLISHGICYFGWTISSRNPCRIRHIYNLFYTYFSLFSPIFPYFFKNMTILLLFIKFRKIVYDYLHSI
jgi:hypothetical protein